MANRNPVSNFHTSQRESKNIYNADNLSFQKKNQEVLGRVNKNKNKLREWCSFWRAYPDIFVDTITPKDSKFRLYFYQRLFLRIAMRYQYMYATFTRAFSKSFLSVLTLYLKCIFYPGVKLFVASGGKEQAANIAKEKIEELWDIFPVLQRELKEWSFQKDYVKLTFQNGSKLDIVAVQNSTRGGRRHGGLIEETILVDGQKLSEIIIPLMNVDRRAKNGDVDYAENHKSQIYVTTAGYKNTFAYQKMVQLLVWMVVKGNAFVFGGDWGIPVLHGLLNPNFVDELKDDGTYNETSFAREYDSIWSGTSEDAFFDGDMIDRHRTVEAPEFEPDMKKKGIEYIVSCDVARAPGAQNADTVAMVIKATPRKNGTYLKKIVYIEVFNGEHFNEQAVKLKRLVTHYNARQLVVDANGLGIGLVDYLIRESVDDKTGETFPPYSVTNDSDYDKFRTPQSLPLLFNVKAGSGNSSQIHVNCLSQISSGKVKFLIDNMTAKAKLLNAKNSQGGKLSESDLEYAKRITPHLVTDIMKEEMLNLQRKAEGKNIILERINKKIGKDKFSALEYGLWYYKLKEDKNVKRYEDVDSDAFLLIKSPKWKTTFGR